MKRENALAFKYFLGPWELEPAEARVWPDGTGRLGSEWRQWVGVEQMEDRRDCKSEKGKGEGKRLLNSEGSLASLFKETSASSLLTYEVECYLCRDSYFFIKSGSPCFIGWGSPMN